MVAEPWGLRVLKALDRLWNALSLGDDEETFSHRSARAKARGSWWGRAVCRVLDLFEKGHCDRVLTHPNKADATVPVDGPLIGDANSERSA